MIDNPGHLNLIRATQICQSLARMGHQLSKLNDTPAVDCDKGAPVIFLIYVCVTMR